MSQEIIVRECESLDEFHRCVELQREIWGEADLEVEPATMFVVAGIPAARCWALSMVNAWWDTRSRSLGFATAFLTCTPT